MESARFARAILGWDWSARARLAAAPAAAKDTAGASRFEEPPGWRLRPFKDCRFSWRESLQRPASCDACDASSLQQASPQPPVRSRQQARPRPERGPWPPEEPQVQAQAPAHRSAPRQEWRMRSRRPLPSVPTGSVSYLSRSPFFPCLRFGPNGRPFSLNIMPAACHRGKPPKGSIFGPLSRPPVSPMAQSVWDAPALVCRRTRAEAKVRARKAGRSPRAPA